MADVGLAKLSQPFAEAARGAVNRHLEAIKAAWNLQIDPADPHELKIHDGRTMNVFAQLVLDSLFHRSLRERTSQDPLPARSRDKFIAAAQIAKDCLEDTPGLKPVFNSHTRDPAGLEHVIFDPPNRKNVYSNFVKATRRSTHLYLMGVLDFKDRLLDSNDLDGLRMNRGLAKALAEEIGIVRECYHLMHPDMTLLSAQSERALRENLKLAKNNLAKDDMLKATTAAKVMSSVRGLHFPSKILPGNNRFNPHRKP